MRDPLHFVSVKYKLALAFAGLCLLAFGVGGFLISRSARSALEEQIDARIDIQCRATAKALGGQLHLLGRRTEDFASDGFIRERVEALLRAIDPAERDAYAAELRTHLLDNKLPLVKSFVGLTLVSTEGEVLVHADHGDAPVIESVLQQARGEMGIWHSDLLTVADAPATPRQAISTPLLRLEGGEPIGRLVAWVSPNVWVASSLAGLPPTGGQSVAARTPTSLRVVDPTGRSLIPREGKNGFISVRLDDERSTRAASASDGHFARDITIDENNWEVRMRMRTVDVFAPVSGLQSRFLGVGVILTLLCAALLFFPMQFLVRPLSELREAARKIRAGDYDVRVEADGADEIGELARSFNHMAESVAQKTSRLRGAAEELRVQQRELRTQHERLDTVIQTMRDGLVVLDADGKPVLANAAARPLLDVLKRHDDALSSHYVCRQKGDEDSCSTCLLHRKGITSSCVLDVGRRVYEVTATQLPPDGEGARGRVLLARDITERVEQDERDIHQERLSVLGEVAAVMAHELNNPLTSIRMFAQMLADSLPEGSPFRDHADVIVRNTETCRHSIGELLGYATDSAPEAGPVHLHDVIHDVAHFVRPLAERAGVSVETEFAAGYDVITGDEIQIRQLFVNLVLNAVQAAGGKPTTVTIKTCDTDDAFVADVVDTGPGITADARDRVFDAFFSTKPRGEGTGLGLPTARRIAELHSGNIELLESAPGRTVFRVRLRVIAKVTA